MSIHIYIYVYMHVYIYVYIYTRSVLMFRAQTLKCIKCHAIKFIDALESANLNLILFPSFFASFDFLVSLAWQLYKLYIINADALLFSIFFDYFFFFLATL